MPRWPPKAPPRTCSTRWRRLGPFGQGYPQPVLVMPHHQLVDVRAVGAGHVRADLRSAVGGRVQAIAFRAAESPLGDFLFKARGTSDPCRRRAFRKLLERGEKRAIPHRRRGRGLVSAQVSTVCIRWSSPICALVAS